MSYCPYCGAEIADGVSFCRNCGKKISDLSDATTKNNNQKMAGNAATSQNKTVLINSLIALKKYFNQKEAQYNCRNQSIYDLRTIKQPSGLYFLIAGGVFAYFFYLLAGIVNHHTTLSFWFFIIFWVFFGFGGYISATMDFQKKTDKLKKDLEITENELKAYYENVSNCLILNFLKISYSFSKD